MKKASNNDIPRCDDEESKSPKTDQIERMLMKLMVYERSCASIQSDSSSSESGDELPLTDPHHNEWLVSSKGQHLIEERKVQQKASNLSLTSSTVSKTKNSGSGLVGRLQRTRL
jgi:hypothetical protein